MLTPESYQNRSPLRKVGMYLLLFVALGVGGSMLIYISNMQLFGWTMGGQGAIFSRSAVSSVRVHLYQSASTQRFFTSVGGNYEVLLKPWRAYARANDIHLNEIQSLDNLSPSMGEVLVLPSAVALGDAERTALLRYKTEGGNVLLTWAAGSRDAAGKWVGWDFLKQMANVTVTGELPADASRNHLVSLGEGPLTHGLAAGTRIWLGRLAERPIVFRGGVVAAQATTLLRGSPASDVQEGILVFQEQEFGSESSRVVLMGAAETSWEYQPQDIHHLVSGALGWLTRQPAVFRSNWPNGLAAAYMIGVDVDDAYPNALRVADAFNLAGYKGSYYLLTSVAKKNPQPVRLLQNTFDVGYRGDTLARLKGQPASIQVQRVKTMLSDMSSALGRSAVLPGFRAPFESYDVVTEQALYEAGVRYHLSDEHESKSRLPFFVAIKGEQAGERFVALPRTVRDGEGLLSDSRGDKSLLEQALQDDFQAVRTQGGLGVLSVQAGSLGPSSPLDQAIPKFIALMRNHANTVWLADGARIARWWNERERFQIGLRPSGARMELDVSVVGKEAFDQGALIVTLARKGQLPTIRALKPGMPVPVVSRLDDFRAVIRFGNLPAGNYSYQLTH